MINFISTTHVNMDIGEQERLGSREDYPFSELIHLARRIDWRFLLPSPVLARVGYIGIQDSSLIEALELFSESLSIFNEIDPLHEDGAAYDIVVISGSDIEAVHKATGLVKPGGCLYVESFGYINQILGRSKMAGGKLNRLRLNRPRGYNVLLKEEGFTDIQFHWHWPNFKECTKIIPLDDKTVQYIFLHARQSAKARLRAFVGRMLSRIGLLESLVPHFSVIAMRAGE